MRGHLHCRFDEGEASVKEAQCLLPFRIPLFIPLGGTAAAFPPEPTRLRVRAGSDGQGRPFGRPASRGRLDGRVIRRATMIVFGSGPACDKVRVALVMVGSIEAPQGRPDTPAPQPRPVAANLYVRLGPRRVSRPGLFFARRVAWLCFTPPLCRRRAPKAGTGRVQ